MAQRVFLNLKKPFFSFTSPLAHASTLLRVLSRPISRSVSGSAAVNGITVEKVDRCVVLRMERGENRLNKEFISAMNQAMDTAESYEDTTAVVTTGKGKHYSLGLDLEEFDSLSASERIDFFDDFEKLMCRTLTFPLITVAAINGHVYAAGSFFAMVQDYRVMRSERGWYCLPEVTIKRNFSVGMYAMLKSHLPLPTLHKAAVLGQRFTAEEAKEAKIVDEVCPMSELEERALSAARRLAGEDGLDRRMLAMIKRDLYRDTCAALNEPVRFYSD